MSSRQFVVVIHPDATDDGFWTEVPALPGCGSQGESVAEAVEMTKDSIAGFIESLRKHGDPVPEETTLAVTVTVAA